MNSLAILFRAVASWHVRTHLPSLLPTRFIKPQDRQSVVFKPCMLFLHQEIRSEDLHNEVSQVLNGYKQVPRILLTNLSPNYHGLPFFL